MCLLRIDHLLPKNSGFLGKCVVPTSRSNTDETTEPNKTTEVNHNNNIKNVVVYRFVIK